MPALNGEITTMLAAVNFGMILKSQDKSTLKGVGRVERPETEALELRAKLRSMKQYNGNQKWKTFLVEF
jgi:hypothetical protein